MEYLAGYLDSESESSQQGEESDNFLSNEIDDWNKPEEWISYNVTMYIDDIKARYLPGRRLAKALFSDQILVTLFSRVLLV